MAQSKMWASLSTLQLASLQQQGSLHPDVSVSLQRLWAMTAGVRSYCTPKPPGGLPTLHNSKHRASYPSLPPPQMHSCPTCSSPSHQQAQAMALTLQGQQQPRSTFFSQAHPMLQQFPPQPLPYAVPGHLQGGAAPHQHAQHAPHAGPTHASMCTISLAPPMADTTPGSGPAWSEWLSSGLQGPGTSSSPAITQRLALPRRSAHRPHTHHAVRGWGPAVTWSSTAVASVAALGATELMLLPMLAPGLCMGTLAAEGLWSAAGWPSSLAGLLAASDNLEAVQAFSTARKLGQLALLDLAMRAVTGGQHYRAFGIRLADPLNKQHGWYYWACLGLVGLGAVTLAHQGCDALVTAWQQGSSIVPGALAGQAPLDALPSSTGGGAAGWLPAGDERTLPFRCRWWAETCVLAPVLEETLFRGFLFASLTKYMPVWGALLASSTAFAVCHLGHAPLTDLPQLTAMGMVLGMVFLRSGNLLAPMAAHCVHNTAALVAAMTGA